MRKFGSNFVNCRDFSKHTQDRHEGSNQCKTANLVNLVTRTILQKFLKVRGFAIHVDPFRRQSSVLKREYLRAIAVNTVNVATMSVT